MMRIPPRTPRVVCMGMPAMLSESMSRAMVRLDTSKSSASSGAVILSRCSRTESMPTSLSTFKTSLATSSSRTATHTGSPRWLERALCEDGVDPADVYPSPELYRHLSEEGPHTQLGVVVHYHARVCGDPGYDGFPR